MPLRVQRDGGCARPIPADPLQVAAELIGAVQRRADQLQIVHLEAAGQGHRAALEEARAIAAEHGSGSEEALAGKAEGARLDLDRARVPNGRLDDVPAKNPVCWRRPSLRITPDDPLGKSRVPSWSIWNTPALVLWMRP